MRKDLKSMAKMMGKLSVAKKEGKLPTYEASYTDAVATKWKDKGGKAAYIKAAKAYNQKKYGTTNPSDDSSKAKITRAELASKKTASDKANANTADANKAATNNAKKGAEEIKTAAAKAKAKKEELASRTNVKKDRKRKKKTEVISKDGETVTKTKTKYDRKGNIKRSKIKDKKA
tara:strand:- start:59 stop:583 length:525 start_codon:yes stop_codon:yes gene_type:complete